METKKLLQHAGRSIMPRDIVYNPRLCNRFAVFIDFSRTDRFLISLIQRNQLRDNVFPALYNVFLFKENVTAYFKANPLQVLQRKKYPVY